LPVLFNIHSVLNLFHPFSQISWQASSTGQ
jgi:hypothetical protein